MSQPNDATAGTPDKFDALFESARGKLNNPGEQSKASIVAELAESLDAAGFEIAKISAEIPRRLKGFVGESQTRHSLPEKYKRAHKNRRIKFDAYVANTTPPSTSSLTPTAPYKMAPVATIEPTPTPTKDNNNRAAASGGSTVAEKDKDKDAKDKSHTGSAGENTSDDSISALDADQLFAEVKRLRVKANNLQNALNVINQNIKCSEPFGELLTENAGLKLKVIHLETVIERAGGDPASALAPKSASELLKNAHTVRLPLSIYPTLFAAIKNKRARISLEHDGVQVTGIKVD